MPPKSRRAARRASGDGMPRSILAWVSISRWNASSSSSSRATRRRWSNARRRVKSAANIERFPRMASSHLEQAADGERELLPVGRLGVQAPPAGGGQSIDPRFAVVLGRRHLGRQQASRLEAMKRWIQRALADAESVAGDLADALLDAPAVIGRERESLEDEE